MRTESIYVDMVKMRKKGFAPVNRVAGRAESHCCRHGWQRKTAFLLAWQAGGIIVKIPSNTDKKDSVSRWNAEHPRNLGDDDREAAGVAARKALLAHGRAARSCAKLSFFLSYSQYIRICIYRQIDR